MLDACGRTIDYLRISVTDRCNLRCVYCMPEEGVNMVSHSQVLSYEEILHLVRIFADLGVKKVKLTGGEPLIRRNMEDLIRGLNAIDGIQEVTLTTNGILLEDQGEAILDAGLAGVNISLDTLDKEHFAQITRGGDVDAVLKGMHKVLACSDIPVKINCVPNDISDDEIIALAELARDYKLSVRFIELMPIGMGKDKIDAVIASGDEAFYNQEQRVRRILEHAYGPMIEYTHRLGNGPSEYVTIEGFRGTVGFISAMSHKFCNKCNRIRLTSEGILKTCLQYESGYDLLAILRRESLHQDDGMETSIEEALRQAIEEAIYGKPQEHHFLETNLEMDGDENGNEPRLMSQIGG